MRTSLLIASALLTASCHNPTCNALDHALTSVARSCGGTQPSAADIKRCDKNISKCGKADLQVLNKYASCMSQVACNIDGGFIKGDPLGCAFEASSISAACLSAIEPQSDDKTGSGADPNIP